MKTDVNGCSTCLRGKEQHETFYLTIGRKKLRRVQYDYRRNDGELFTCIARSLEEARAKRDDWLSQIGK